MSLQVWLPLNGDLRNQGLSDVQVTTPTVATFDNAGKIGKCLLYNSKVSIPATQVASIFNNEHMSIAFWYNNNGGSTSSHSICGFQGNSEGDSGASRIYDFFQYSSKNDFHWSMGTLGGGVLNGVILDNTWIHICVIYNSGNLKIYINGILNHDSSGHSSAYTFNKSYYINFGYGQKLNDFRIYDHALSVKEIKELAKGLVLHYPLNSPYEIGKINKYSGTYTDGEFSSSSFTKIKLANEQGYNYKYNYTGNGNNSWPNACVPHFTFTVGKTYYYSMKVRCNKWTAGSLSLRAARSDNDWVTRSVVICSSSLADGKWHEYYTYQTIDSTYIRSGSTITCNPVLEVYCSNLNGNGTLYDFDFDVKDIQVIESDFYVPYLKNEYGSNIVADTSGYRNDGVSSGTILVSKDTARYDASTYFTAGSGIFSHPNLTLSQFTISFWAKHTEKGKMVFGSNISASSTNTTWYWYGDKSFKYPNGEYYYTYNAGSEDNLLGKWTHFVAVYNGSNIQIYRNSISEGSKAVTGNMILEYLSVGNGFNQSSFWENSNVSDFRLYATALSAADIKALYNESASIDKNGNFHAYEYVEDDNIANVDINKQGVFTVPEEIMENSLKEPSIDNKNIYAKGGFYED